MKQKKAKINRSNEQNMPKKWYEKRLPKIGIAVAMVILIGIPIWYLFGYIIGRQYGFSTSEDAIKNVLTNIESNDKYNLSKSFECTRKEPAKTLDMLESYSKSVKGTYELSMTSDYTSFDEYEIDASSLKDKLGFTPDAAKYAVISIESKQTRGNRKCNGICLYEATTYETKDKWYVCTFNELNYEILSMEKVNIDEYTIGSNKLGWLPINSNTWNVVSSENAIFENAETLTCTLSTDTDTSTIVVSALHDVTAYDDAINKIKDALSSETGCVNVQTFDDELNGLKCKRIISTHIINNKAITSYTWLVKNTMKDPYVHQITLTTTDAINTYPIVMAYTL